SQRGLLGGAHGEGGGAVCQRQGAVPHRTNAADDGTCRGRHALAGVGTEAPGDATSGGAVSGSQGVLVRANVRRFINREQDKPQRHRESTEKKRILLCAFSVSLCLCGLSCSL